MITSSALKAGFSGGLIVDYPNSAKAKKYFLVIEAGARRNLAIVEVQGKMDGMEDEEVEGEPGNGEVKVAKEREQKHEHGYRGKKKLIKRKDFVLKKK
jgi:18S rRNA (guanine1575-N7)-methyltransferase